MKKGKRGEEWSRIILKSFKDFETPFLTKIEKRGSKIEKEPFNRIDGE